MGIRPGFAGELAEEWRALIDDRPVGVLKLATGLSFLARGALHQDRSAMAQGATRARRSLGKLPTPGDGLIWLYGASPAILRLVPAERQRYQGLGGLVMMTASMAGISAVLALDLAFDAPAAIAVPLAIASALSVVSLDR